MLDILCTCTQYISMQYILYTIYIVPVCVVPECVVRIGILRVCIFTIDTPLQKSFLGTERNCINLTTTNYFSLNFDALQVRKFLFWDKNVHKSEVLVFKFCNIARYSFCLELKWKRERNMQFI